jgi:hypothetical protein
MEFQVRTVSAVQIDGWGPPGDAEFFSPARYDIQPLGECTITPIDVEVVAALSGENIFVIYTTHRHDGTLLFTLAAVDAVCQSLENLMSRLPGEWESSRVVVTVEDSPTPWMGHEVVALLCRRKQHPTNEQGGEGRG